ncbi:hypothetical protein [Streptomyces sp. cg35]|uniref:hypothetical protein n=1 Tax=Streptomyces sp. cg35 TaxID=3421650 RepID=UPI003D1775D2
MPTATTEIPSYLTTAMQAAYDASWEVTRRSKSAVFIPPQGKRVTVQYTRDEAWVKEALTEAGLYAPEPEPAPEAAPQAVEAAEATAADEADSSDGRMQEHQCPECSNHYRGGQGLASHRRSAHGITNTTTRPGFVSSTGLPGDLVEAAQLLLGRVSAHINQAPTGELMEAEAEIERLNRKVETLTRRLDSSVPKSAKESRDREIKDLRRQVRELAAFRTKVEAMVSDPDKSPVQMIFGIVKAGGHGFGVTSK